jgi:hypothetical protein
VAENNSRAGFGVLRKILENCEDKDGSLSHSGYCLAEYINTENSLWNALLLHIRRMLKTAIDNGML